MRIRIANVIAKSGLSSVDECVLIGLELNNGRVVWGHLVHLPQATSTLQLIEQQIIPILQDQPLDSFQTLISQIDDLKESVTTTRIIQPVPESSASGVTMSRRRLITGLLTEDEPETEEVKIERPYQPALRFGISQVLFKAFTLCENKPLLIVLSDLVAQPLSKMTAVPLLVGANETNMSLVQPVLATAVAAIGYSTGLANHKQILGSNAERLQAHVRQVKDWLTAVASDAQPDIHLNIQGAFSELYDNNEGKILGALYGLEQAARPNKLVIENVVKGEATAVADTLNTVQSYLKSRQMQVSLAAGYSLFAPEALRTLVQKTAVQQIHLDPTRFGSINQIIQFILECKKQEIAVIIHGEREVAETAVALALATQAHALSGPPDILYNEMIKFSL